MEISQLLSRTEYFKDIFIYSEILILGLCVMGTGYILANKRRKNPYCHGTNSSAERETKRNNKYLYFKLEGNEYSIVKWSKEN